MSKFKPSLQLKLIIMNFLEFAIWGAYLTSQGKYLGAIGFSERIGYFFTVQGIVSIFMPAIIGAIADRWVAPQKMLGFCHLIASVFMIATGYYGYSSGADANFTTLFSLYTVSVAFYMPTLALTNSVAYNLLDQAHMDSVKAFPPIRVWGTIGFIASMWFVDLTGFDKGPWQYVTSGVIGLALAIYAFTLPNCIIEKNSEKKSLWDTMGLSAFTLFKSRKMAMFFIFSMLLGILLQITNGYANPYISGFKELPEYANAFFAKHSTILISLSQISEALCILLIPFFLKKYGIKVVMLLAMLAWVFRFALLGLGNPVSGVWLFFLSMIVYGIAFDFFNISGSLFVDNNTDSKIRSSAQGLFMLMTNGLGAAIGTIAAQKVVNQLVYSKTDMIAQYEGWRQAWFVFAGFALLVAILFAILFRYKHTAEETK
ncbi:MAG: MFS transporter [Bacteroidales bacterium]|nr:MFS transporter [Bacteroidales bacterium]